MRKLLGKWHYGVILTYLSVLSAVVGICFSVICHTWVGVICLLISGVCDAFDGTVARTRKNRDVADKAFGVQIDSLSDLAAFGVAPAMIGFGLGMDRWYYIPVFALYTLFALVRLAHFNVDEQLRSLDGVEMPRTYYEGLPVTSAAVVVPIVWIAASIVWHFKDLRFLSGVMMAATLCVLAVLFVLPFRVRKLKTRGTVILIVAVAVCVVALLIVKGVVFRQMCLPPKGDIPL